MKHNPNPTPGVLVDRLLRLHEETEAIAGDVRDILTEADHYGHGPILRAVVRELSWRSPDPLA